jgi:uncharacterized membrane protein YeaQ/YmgE (transglycosylase-associated protein family)
MGILWTIVLGFVIGLIAKLIHPGKENMGFIMTILLGIAGSFLAGIIGQLIGWYKAGQGAGLQPHADLGRYSSFRISVIL